MEQGRLADAHGSDTVPPRANTKRVKVRTLLENTIEANLHPGDAIASERELVRELGVSRVTVRQAISDLVDSGRLERVHGKGTFVTGPLIDSRLHLMSFSREMRARGLDPQTKVLRTGEEEAMPEVAERLRIRHGAKVVRVERLRLADGTPMAHEVGFYPSAMFPGLLDRPLDSLYDIFAIVYDVWVTAGEQTIRAEAADSVYAAILKIGRRMPLLVQERVTWAGDQVMEYATSRYRGDRYRIHTGVTPTGTL